MTSSKFEACHHVVGPLPYLQNCHYDVCSCSDGRDCLCNAVASYAAACARKGVHVAWREPSFCGGCPPCPSPTPHNPTESAAGALNLHAHVLCKALSGFLRWDTGPGASDRHAVWKQFICSPLPLPSPSRTRWWDPLAHRTGGLLWTVPRGQVGPHVWRLRTLASWPSRYFLWLLPPSVGYTFSQDVE